MRCPTRAGTDEVLDIDLPRGWLHARPEERCPTSDGPGRLLASLVLLFAWSARPADAKPRGGDVGANAAGRAVFGGDQGPLRVRRTVTPAHAKPRRVTGRCPVRFLYPLWRSRYCCSARDRTRARLPKRTPARRPSTTGRVRAGGAIGPTRLIGSVHAGYDSALVESTGAFLGTRDDLANVMTWLFLQCAPRQTYGALEIVDARRPDCIAFESSHWRVAGARRLSRVAAASDAHAAGMPLANPGL